jgi:hypothetical protein
VCLIAWAYPTFILEYSKIEFEVKNTSKIFTTIKKVKMDKFHNIVFQVERKGMVV